MSRTRGFPNYGNVRLKIFYIPKYLFLLPVG